MTSEIENKRPNITKGEDVKEISSRPIEEKAAEGREEKEESAATTNTARTAAPYNRDEKTVE
jgi:hypothetical protein